MSSVTFEPVQFYDATVVCVTESCPNFNTPMEVTELYSNAGTPVVQCGLCRQSMEILSATPMDPQPEMS